MIFQPVINVLLLMLLFAPVAAVAVWMLVRALRRRSAAAAGPATSDGAGALMWMLRLLMLIACFAMLLRPGIPGGTTQTLATQTDVVIVLDTTASIAAEDWNGSEQRLEGVRADVQAIVDEYPGARFALITFDASAQQRLPLTSDTTALISSLDLLRPEVTARSQGSSIGIANRMLYETLAAAAEYGGDRSRMVFYLGDGEQTASRDPESFASSAKYVDGGAVLGYGTSAGGPMRITTGDPSAGGGDYIEYQGERALSIIDDANLQDAAAQLGVGYQLRSADTALDLPSAPVTTSTSADGSVGNVIELYWIAAIAMVLLLGIELARAAMLIAQMRGLAIRGGGR